MSISKLHKVILYIEIIDGITYCITRKFKKTLVIVFFIINIRLEVANNVKLETDLKIVVTKEYDYFRCFFQKKLRYILTS